MLPVMGRLLKAFNFAYQPRSHACDLVQALHVVLRMLDRLNASGRHCCWLLSSRYNSAALKRCTWKASGLPVWTLAFSCLIQTAIGYKGELQGPLWKPEQINTHSEQGDVESCGGRVSIQTLHTICSLSYAVKYKCSGSVMSCLFAAAS